jgi:hypothetical protein
MLGQGTAGDCAHRAERMADSDKTGWRDPSPAQSQQSDDRHAELVQESALELEVLLAPLLLALVRS